MTSNKATGSDRISAELVEINGRRWTPDKFGTYIQMTGQIAKITRTENYEIYQTISLTTYGSKILTRIIYGRIYIRVEEVLEFISLVLGKIREHGEASLCCRLVIEIIRINRTEDTWQLSTWRKPSQCKFE